MTTQSFKTASWFKAALPAWSSFQTMRIKGSWVKSLSLFTTDNYVDAHISAGVYGETLLRPEWGGPPSWCLEKYLYFNTQLCMPSSINAAFTTKINWDKKKKITTRKQTVALSPTPMFKMSYYKKNRLLLCSADIQLFLPFFFSFFYNLPLSSAPPTGTMLLQFYIQVTFLSYLQLVLFKSFMTNGSLLFVCTRADYELHLLE